MESPRGPHVGRGLDTGQHCARRSGLVSECTGYMTFPCCYIYVFMPAVYTCKVSLFIMMVLMSFHVDLRVNFLLCLSHIL